jgi:hypothetical protein
MVSGWVLSGKRPNLTRKGSQASAAIKPGAAERPASVTVKEHG